MAWVNEVYDKLYAPNTVCVACISHGKDSLAMLRAIKLLGLPLHRIVTTDVWATQDIPADLPPMWEWKKKADKIIKDLYGIEVEHLCAMAREKSNEVAQTDRRLSYEAMFYKRLESGKFKGNIKGFPQTIGAWCKKIKYEKVDLRKYILSTLQGRGEVRLCNTSQSVLPRETQDIAAFQSPSDKVNGLRSSSSFSQAPRTRGRI